MAALYTKHGTRLKYTHQPTYNRATSAATEGNGQQTKKKTKKKTKCETNKRINSEYVSFKCDEYIHHVASKRKKKCKLSRQ